MNKTQFTIGVVAGILISIIGCFLYLYFFTKLPVLESYTFPENNNKLGKLIALGTTPNLILFAFLLKRNNETMAKGLIAAVMLLALISFVI